MGVVDEAFSVITVGQAYQSVIVLPGGDAGPTYVNCYILFKRFLDWHG